MSHICRHILIAAAVQFAAVAPAEAEPSQQHIFAVMVEWYVANCGLDDIPALAISTASMIINATDKSTLDPLRVQARAKVASRYLDTPAACAEMKKIWK